MVEMPVRDRDRHNVVLWIILIGSVSGVLVLRSFSGEGISALDWVAVSIAACAVGGYAVYAWWVSRSGELTIGRDQAGDNAYYIGLLLTFASLGVALVKLVVLIDTDAQAGERQVAVAGQVAQLIPDFGVALSSTVFGIAARLWLQQQRMSPAEAAEDARRELERGVAEFSSTLRFATGVMSTSTNAIRLGVAKQLEEAAFGQVESFEEAQELIRDAATEMTRGLGALAPMLADVNAKVAGELAKLQEAQPGQALVDLANRSRDAAVAVTEMLRKVDRASEQAGGLSDELGALQKRLAAVGSGDETARLDAMIQSAASNAERLGNAIAQGHLQTSAAETLLKKAANDAKALQAETGRAANTASEVRAGLDATRDAAQAVEGGLEGMEDHVRGVEAELRAASTNVTNVVKETENAASALVAEVSTVAQELRNLETALQAVEREMAAVRPDVTGFAERLTTLLPEGKAKEFRGAVAKVQQRLEELGEQTNSDIAVDAVVRVLDRRLRDIEGRLTADTTQSTLTEPISTSRDTRIGGNLIERFRLRKQ